ncbi:MAG: SDR family NAD(P)-dependent oxidoreductase [Burkholderiales bacterium]
MPERDSDLPRTPTMRLDGLTSVVTGAGRGLGRACAVALADAGSEVVLVSRTPSELETLATMIRQRGGKAHALACDILDARQIAERIETLDRIDVLVNNAGGNIPEPFVQVTEERLDRILSLNVRAAFLVAQAVSRRMIADGRGGSIIHMSSQMGHVGAPNRTVYCMTKHAIEGLSKAMAVELAPHRVRVNAIGPTFVVTPMTRPFFEQKAFREDTLSRIPIGRLAELEDIMGAIVFLASPAAAMVTGASLTIDGGWTAW